MEFTHNNQRHADQMKTPFKLMFGEPPITLPLSFENTKYPAVEDRMKTLIKNREEVLAAHEPARTHMADRQKSTFIPFKKGDKVWLDSRNMKTRYNKKMKPKWEEPFIIAEVLGPVTYRLQLPSSWQIHNVFHATLLQSYKENDIYGSNFPEPPTELENKEEVYEVDSIINHQKLGWGYQYYVKWKGYPISEASWEPEQAFSDDGDMLTLYKNWHQLWNFSKRNEDDPQKDIFKSHHLWRCYKWTNQTHAELCWRIWQIPEASWRLDNKNRHSMRLTVIKKTVCFTEHNKVFLIPPQESPSWNNLTNPFLNPFHWKMPPTRSSRPYPTAFSSDELFQFSSTTTDIQHVYLLLAGNRHLHDNYATFILLRQMIILLGQLRTT